MSPTNGNSTRYRADIDGLRAVAVLAVLFFHAGIGCSGGYVGVDVFFVISGYLITGLILKESDAGQFRVLEFWERRVLRIFPALAIVVLTCVVAGWFQFLPHDFKSLGQSVLAQAMLVSNINFWLEAGYFAASAEVKPLLHTWSLAVEEQFYLLFPLLLIGFKRLPRNSLAPALLLLCCASFGLSVYGSYRHPSANFFLLPTRAWELLIGSFLAAVPAPRSSTRWLMESFSWCGLLGILGAVFFYDEKTRFPGVAAILPCVGTALLIWSNSHALTSVGRLLAMPPMVFAGLISYSLYLWHWPLLVFYKYWTLDPIPIGHRLLHLLASVGIAVMSWKFVETPFRKRLVLKGRTQIFAFASITTVALSLTGMTISQLRGLPARFPPDVIRYAAGEIDRAFTKEVGLKQALIGNFIELGMGDRGLPVGLLVWGDSHAMAAMPVFDKLCKEQSVRGVAAVHSSNLPLIGYESQIPTSLKQDGIPFNQAVVEYIRNKRVGDVVLVAMWGGYVTDAEIARLRRGLFKTIDALKHSGSRIWIMRQVPQHSWNVPKALAFAVIQGHDPNLIGLPLAEHERARRLQDQIFEGISALDVKVLDPTVLFLSSEITCRVAKDGQALYYDYHHLSVAGAMVLQPLVRPIFEGMGKRPAASVSDKGDIR